MTEHAPCPWCKTNADLEAVDIWDNRGAWANPDGGWLWHVHCMECDCVGPSAMTSERSWELWDGRAQETPFAGTRYTRNGDITIGAISPQARDLLDSIMETYEKAYDPHHFTARPEQVYQFAYWLIRWSGLVRNNNT